MKQKNNLVKLLVYLFIFIFYNRSYIPTRWWSMANQQSVCIHLKSPFGPLSVDLLTCNQFVLNYN